MKLFSSMVFLVLFLFTQSVFANMSMNDESSMPCKKVVKACLHAGYVKKNKSGKEFWHDCMLPALLGKEVKGVSISADDATACKEAKITELKADLESLQQGQ